MYEIPCLPYKICELMLYNFGLNSAFSWCIIMLQLKKMNHIDIIKDSLCSASLEIELNSMVWEKLIEEDIIPRTEAHFIKTSVGSMTCQVKAVLEWLKRKDYTVYVKFRDVLLLCGQGKVATKYFPRLYLGSDARSDVSPPDQSGDKSYSPLTGAHRSDTVIRRHSASDFSSRTEPEVKLISDHIHSLRRIGSSNRLAGSDLRNDENIRHSPSHFCSPSTSTRSPTSSPLPALAREYPTTTYIRPTFELPMPTSALPYMKANSPKYKTHEKLPSKPLAVKGIHHLIDDTCIIPKDKRKQPDKYAILEEEVNLSYDIPNRSTIQWYKDSKRLTDSNRLKLITSKGKATLVLDKVSLEDAGNYMMLATQNDRPICIECCLNVFGPPMNVKAKPVSSTSVHVTWHKAVGQASQYKIKSRTKSDSKKLKVYNNDDSDDTSIVIDDLKPGEVYQISVISVMGDAESSEQPTGGLTVKTPYIHHGILQVNRHLLREKLDLMPVVNQLEEERLISYNDIEKITSKDTNEEKVDELIQLIQDGNPQIYQAFLAALDASKQGEILSDLECSIPRYRHSRRSLDGSSCSGDLFYTEEFGQSIKKAAGYVSGLPSTEGKRSSGYSEGDASSRGDDRIQCSEFATVIEAYQSLDDDHLFLKEGERVRIIHRNSGCMWMGESEGRKGIFPGNCVRLNSDSGKQHGSLEELQQESESSKGHSVKVPLIEKLTNILTPKTTLDDMILSDETLLVQLNHQGFLKICNKKEPNIAILKLKFWKEVKSKLKPLTIKDIAISFVNIGDCCEKFFRFMSRCINCTSIVIEKLTDGTKDNNTLAHYMCISFLFLKKLRRIDIRNTPLGQGWCNLFQSIISIDMLVFTLYDNNLRGKGDSLAGVIKRTTALQWLGINGSGLTNHELMSVLSNLPESCPNLQALMLAENNLFEGGEVFVRIIQRLPNLRILNIINCRAHGNTEKILRNLSKGIEVLAIDATAIKVEQFKCLENQTSLKYLHIGVHNFTPENLYLLWNYLSDYGRTLMLGTITNQAKWDRYIQFVTNIRDECLFPFV